MIAIASCRRNTISSALQQLKVALDNDRMFLRIKRKQKMERWNNSNDPCKMKLKMTLKLSIKT